MLGGGLSHPHDIITAQPRTSTLTNGFHESGEAGCVSVLLDLPMYCSQSVHPELQRFSASPGGLVFWQQPTFYS